MSRKLILILNDGGRANYLPGVLKDAQNYLDFFRLPEGGLWDDNEIMIFHNDCTAASLRAYLLQERMGGLQYVVIVFCGHGYSTNRRMTYFELSPGHEASLLEIKEMVMETRCLMIADSCRVTTLAEGGHLPEIRMFSDDRSSDTYRNNCFNLYDQQFRSLVRGHFTIGMAASIGQSAGEDEDGGYYTKVLLSTAKRMITAKKVARRTSRDYDPIANFPLVHAFAKDKFIRSGNTGQTPDIQASRGSQAPFVVVARG